MREGEAYDPAMHRRSRREIDVLTFRLAIVIVVLTGIAVLASASLGIDPNVCLMIGVVLLFVDSGLAAVLREWERVTGRLRCRPAS